MHRPLHNRTTQASSLQKQGKRRRQHDSVLGQGPPGCIPGPRGTGDKVCRETAASLRTGGITHQCRNSPLTALTQQQRWPLPPPQPAAALFPLSLLRLCDSRRAQGSGRCVSPASPPSAPPPAATASPSLLSVSVPAPGLVAWPQFTAGCRRRQSTGH